MSNISDVYFIETKHGDSESRRSALLKLLGTLEPFKEYKKDEFIPVKLTIGDSQCAYHLNPELVKIVISELKKKNVKPFLFDTNVIYKGSRLNAVDHLTLAQNKGFGHSKIGVPFIIADGLFGQDGKEYEIGSDYIKKIKIPSFIGMVNKLIVLSHATCHILSGYAGALKNISMGMCSRPTKQAQHSALKPHVLKEKCTGCGLCIEICPVSAVSFIDKKAFIDQAKCVGCGECLCACKFDAIFINWGEDAGIFAKRMIDVAGFILSKFKKAFYINFAFDITKECDCISTKNEKIVCRDAGILASSDIVSIDKATLDFINKDEDVIFKEKSKHTHKLMLECAYKKGMGNLEYNLKNIK